jgi:hypothetical protein
MVININKNALKCGLKVNSKLLGKFKLDLGTTSLTLQHEIEVNSIFILDHKKAQLILPS